MLTANATDNSMFVISLDIDPTGQAKARIPDLEKSAQLHNTLLQGLFPDIRVARLNVPGGVLEESQQALVEQTMKRVNVDGVQFRLVGASGSAKDGKFYAVSIWRDSVDRLKLKGFASASDRTWQPIEAGERDESAAPGASGGGGSGGSGRPANPDWMSRE